MSRPEVLAEMVATIRTDLAAIEAAIGLADPCVERALRLAGEALDDAACRLRVYQHIHTRSLFGGVA